jgi:diguanylate cyclase (GGDEF)-like protein
MTFAPAQKLQVPDTPSQSEGAAAAAMAVAPALKRRLGGATIRRKIFAAFLAMSVITAALGAYAVASIGRTGDLVVQTFDRSLMSINYARAAAADFAGMEAALARRRRAASDAERAMLDARADELAEQLADDLAIAAERTRSPAAVRAAAAASQAVAAWQAARTSLQMESGDSVPDWVALDAAAAEVTEQIDLLINHTAGDAFLQRRNASALIATTEQLNVGAILAALLLATIVTVLLARKIIGPVAAASAAANRIAKGELDTDIPRAGRDELGALLAALTVMRDNIRAMVAREVAGRRSAQGRLIDAIETSREGVVLVDSSGAIANANTRLRSFFPALSGLLAPGAPFAAFAGAAGQGVFDGDAEATEAALPDGRWLRIGRTTMRDGGLVAIASDITALKRQQAALASTNARFDAALSNMSQGLCLFDRDNLLLVANRRFSEIFGLDPDKVVPGLAMHELIRMSIAAGNYGPIADFAAVKAAREGIIARRQAGTHFQDMADGRVIAIAHEPMDDGGWVATYEDMTDRRRAEARIAHLARHDHLTDLPNRVLFNERLAQAIAHLGRGQDFAVLSLDIDRFRGINETIGHAVGDAVLKQLAERLCACVRETDTVARLAGDDFAVLLVGLDRPEAAAELARRIVTQLGQPYQVDGHAVQLGISIGIAVAPGDGAIGETLLAHADGALTRAKADGGGVFRFFEAAMDARLQQRRALEIDLRRALAEDQFTLFYQPLVNLKQARVSSFEALIRWRHPVRGMVSPGEFIPLAEEIGLIGAIGEWVLRRAARDAALWPADVNVGVNVSPQQFKADASGKPRLVSAVRQALEDSGLDPRRLELEITESTLMDDASTVKDTLAALKQLGTALAMDDFGTGYSSLSTLRAFPFDKIKIDQSFIRALGQDEGAAAIVRVVVALGQSLRLRTTAEGVETAEQLAYLRQEGCTEIQGYYFSPPRPNEEVPGLIQRIGAQLTERRAA